MPIAFVKKIVHKNPPLSPPPERPEKGRGDAFISYLALSTLTLLVRFLLNQTKEHNSDLISLFKKRKGQITVIIFLFDRVLGVFVLFLNILN